MIHRMSIHILSSAEGSFSDPLSDFPEVESTIIVKEIPLPVVYTFDRKGSLLAANIAIPAKIVTSRFPWRELIENLTCSVLMIKPGYLEPGVFLVVRHYEENGEADGLTFLRALPGVREREGKIVGEWAIEKEFASYASLLTILRPDGYPRLSVVSRFDSYGGLLLQ